MTLIRARAGSTMRASLQRPLPDEAFGRDGFRLLPGHATVDPARVLRREDGSPIEG